MEEYFIYSGNNRISFKVFAPNGGLDILKTALTIT